VTTTPVDPDANAIPARFAQLVASPGDRDAAILTCVTAVGAHLGRRSVLSYNCGGTYPTLYALIVTQPSTPAEWFRWYPLFLSDPSPVTKSGISNAEALIHLVRDPVVRPDRVLTGIGVTPEWRRTQVDNGVAEKRHLIMQRLGPQLAGKTGAATRLRDTLNAGYEDGEMSAYLNYRDGGFHGVKAAHLALLIAEPDERVAAAICNKMPFLVAQVEHPPLNASEDTIDKLGDLFILIEEAIMKAPAQVTIESDATWIVQREIASRKLYAGLTLQRVAHILAVLTRSAVVTEALLFQASAIVRASEGTVESLHRGRRAHLGAELLEFMRAAGGIGLSHHELVRRFRRRGHLTADIQKALAELLRRQEVIRTVVKTSGRDRVEWNVPRVQ
jgi:hypothetical protein